MRGTAQPPGRTALDGGVKKEGKFSLRVWLDKAFCYSVNQPAHVQPGAVYRLSYWVKTKDLKGSPGLSFNGTVAVRDPENLLRIIECGRAHVGTTDWVEEVVEFIAPRRGSVMLSCFLSGYGYGSGTAWFDGVRLERIAPPGGIRSLREAPRGTHSRAEWALCQTPADWTQLLAALTDYCASSSNFTEVRVRGRLGEYLTALRSAARTNPALRSLVARLYGEHGWRMPLSVFLTDSVRSLCEEAVAHAAKDTKGEPAAQQQRLSLMRAIALHGDEPAADAAGTLRRLYAASGTGGRRQVGLILRDVGELVKAKAYVRAGRCCDVLLAALDPKAPLRHSAELARLRYLLAAGETEAARQAAEQLTAAERKVAPGVRKEALLALVRLGAASGGAAGTTKWLHVADKEFGADLAARAEIRLAYARALADKGKRDEAILACQGLVALLPQQTGACFDAQRLLVRCLLEERRHDDALAAAKVLYGTAPNSEKEITEAVDLVMRALKAKYRTIALANDFVAFQSHGPNGEDGKKGTEDDLKNPLAEAKWVPPPEIEAIFKKTLVSLPKDFRSRRWRGYLYLYWGKPDMALGEFVRRYDEAPLEQKAVDEAINDLVVALKAYHGHTLAGEQFMAYQKFGPKGKDGKSGTADDLANPLAGLSKK